MAWIIYLLVAALIVWSLRTIVRHLAGQLRGNCCGDCGRCDEKYKGCQKKKKV